MTTDQRIRFLVKPAVFVLCLGPLAWMIGRALTIGLGANPIEYSNRYLGDWALRFILIALAVTPGREILGWSWLARLRRMLGLFAFAYVVLHVLSYVGLDQFFDWWAIGGEILKRQYITVGMIAVTLLIPLAITSTNGMVRRMGGRAWQRLHRLAYVIGMLGCLHFYMMVKSDTREPIIYASILACLLGYRLIAAGRRRLARNRRNTPQPA